MIALPLKQMRAALYQRLKVALQDPVGSLVRVYPFVAEDEGSPKVVLSTFEVLADNWKDMDVMPVTATIEFFDELDGEDRIALAMDAAFEALLSGPLVLADGFEEIIASGDLETATLNAAALNERAILKGVLRYVVKIQKTN